MVECAKYQKEVMFVPKRWIRVAMLVVAGWATPSHCLAQKVLKEDDPKPDATDKH